MAAVKSESAIIKWPDKRLRQESELIPSYWTGREHMFEILTRIADERNAEGLAAPQIGCMKTAFVMRVNGEYIRVINPQITGRSGGRESAVEGCLSLPGTTVRVRRHRKVRGFWVDDSWQLQPFEFTGLPARVFQHEYDHLIGKLIIDRTLGD